MDCARKVCKKDAVSIVGKYEESNFRNCFPSARIENSKNVAKLLVLRAQTAVAEAGC